ncbi:hypothetical protein KAS45_00420, partial [candidate division WOR-3 bacterium]|nr:hypothetical protein [candidate division WOR-3 bacterium]
DPRKLLMVLHFVGDSTIMTLFFATHHYTFIFVSVKNLSNSVEFYDGGDIHVYEHELYTCFLTSNKR